VSKLVHFPATVDRDHALLIGNFDGVHRGHVTVARQAGRMAAARGLCLAVLTFSPHPAGVLGRTPPPLLTTLERRASLLGEHGIDAVFVKTFDRGFALTPPADFARDLLVRDLRAKLVVVGENFRFGHQRAGDLATLVALGRELGFEATSHDMVGDAEGAFSSSRVRAALAAGDVEVASAVLGRPHALRGVVVRGDARGRTLGFPTANLAGVPEMLPAHGVYAARAGVLGRSLPAVVNIGTRPTVDGSRVSIEAHLLDFEGDLYDQPLSLDLVRRLRGEVRFPGLDALRAQILIDVDAARGHLGAGGTPVGS
jgi:riboflavin kinase/FMN adenylyltransferase